MNVKRKQLEIWANGTCDEGTIPAKVRPKDFE